MACEIARMDNTQPNGVAGQEPVTPTPSGQEPNGAQPNGQASLSAEAVQAELKRAREEAASYRVKAKELAEQIEAQKAAALAEQGKYKELYEAETAKLSTFAQEIESLKAKAEELELIKAEQAQRIEAERQAALKELPDDLQATLATASVEAIRAVAAKIKPPSSAAPTKPVQSTPGQPPAASQPSTAFERFAQAYNS